MTLMPLFVHPKSQDQRSIKMSSQLFMASLKHLDAKWSTQKAGLCFKFMDSLILDELIEDHSRSSGTCDLDIWNGELKINRIYLRMPDHPVKWSWRCRKELFNWSDTTSKHRSCEPEKKKTRVHLLVPNFPVKIEGPGSSCSCIIDKKLFF